MKTTILAPAVAALLFTLGCGAAHDSGGGFGGDASSTSIASAGSGAPNLTTATSVASTGSGTSGCDGSNPEGCACTSVGATNACYVGDANQAGVGACVMGSQTCVAQTSGEIEDDVWGPCLGSGAPSAEVCGDMIDNDCNGTTDDGCDDCQEGATQFCNTPSGSGTQTCVNSTWGPCVVTPPGSVGTPCTPGAVQPPEPGDPGCTSGDPDANGPSTILYCDQTGTWQCFPNSGCSESACSTCMQTHCGGNATTTDTSCQESLGRAWSWITSCGPDRSSYFSDLETDCPGGAVDLLQTCRDFWCSSDESGPCNDW